MATRALIHLPGAIRRGDVVEVRSTLQHAMETGYRQDGNGRMLPRDIVHRLEVRQGGELVFAADLNRAISANPFVAFALRVTDGGPLHFRWTGDNHFVHTETVTLNLS
jgi:sulfur-oxidizing protein SoxZ